MLLAFGFFNYLGRAHLNKKIAAFIIFNIKISYSVKEIYEETIFTIRFIYHIVFSL